VRRLLLLVPFFFFSAARAHRDLHSFPTRRSSDLKLAASVYASCQERWPVLAVSSTMSIGDHPAGQIGEVAVFTNGEKVRLYKDRSEEHTSELQSRFDLVCRLLLEKKKQKNKQHEQ